MAQEDGPRPEQPAMRLGGKGLPTWLALGAWTAWVGAVASRHEPWRDEWQAWAIARASATPAELLANLAYEGHPPLWHVLLWAPAQLGAGPWAMQLLAGLAALAAAGLVLFKAPFPFWTRVLVVASYPFAFEWAVVARGYGLGLALAMAACALWPGRHARPWALAIPLALLPFTSAYGALLALAFAAALATEAPAWREAFRARPDATGLAAALPVAGLLGAAWLAKPPADFVPGAGLHDFPLGFLVPEALARIGQGLFPLPGVPATPWGTTALLGWPALLAAIAGLAAWWWLGPRGDKAATAFFAAGIGGLLAMALFLHLGVLRHSLHYEVVAIVALWLAAERTPKRGASQAGLALLLAPSVAAAVWVGGADLARPFSNGPAMAAWIRTHPDPAPLLATPDYAAVSVAAPLDQPIFMLEASQPRRFVRWDRARFPDDRTRFAAVREAVAAGRAVRVLTNRPLDPARVGRPATLLHAEAGAIVADEDFYLYRVGP